MTKNSISNIRQPNSQLK
jgi:hypothetical protein